MNTKINKLNNKKNFLLGAAWGWLIPMIILDPTIALPPFLMISVAIYYNIKLSKELKLKT